ncbi:hypothetical protein B0T18DRAFT_401066 [Schizothecium vesticola]|uniref:Uncharacterized protein n=1 Tax=Schizothecium vesticola TaxID=314040 RepID=A0AA40F423_9PEZI|nr:hypothetical protein B0T18DRAFT_401066 [Schizothecium vesticola]
MAIQCIIMDYCGWLLPAPSRQRPVPSRQRPAPSCSSSHILGRRPPSTAAAAFHRISRSGPGAFTMTSSQLPSNHKKRVDVTISTRNLPWETLKEYLGLRFPENPVNSAQTISKEVYIVALPRQLNTDELQDLEILRGDDAKAFLQDLIDEREEEVQRKQA